MLRFPHLSIGVILPAILVSMTVLLVGAGAATVFRADAQARRSARAVVLTEASRSLLGALLATRRERSTFLTSFASGEHRSEADAASLVTLGQRVTDGTEQVLTWLRAAEADVTATAEPLQRAHEALVALRQEAAAALALPKAQRSSATRDAAEARYQALLAALAAANEAVDARSRARTPPWPAPSRSSAAPGRLGPQSEPPRRGSRPRSRPAPVGRRPRRSRRPRSGAVSRQPGPRSRRPRRARCRI
jgi:hypothetical protein